MSRTSTVANGSPCPQCRGGTMRVEARTPILRSPGKSEVLFRCTQCAAEVRQVQDDRFGD
jgi:hypothetical protein